MDALIDNFNANHTYLNSAGCGLISSPALEAANNLNNSISTNGSIAFYEWFYNSSERIKETSASFLGTQTNNVGLIPNFSFGINAVVQSIKSKSRVLLYKNDFPSLTEPFRINNFDISWLNDDDSFTISIDKLKQQALEDNVDIIALSHVQWMSGYKVDLISLGIFCKEHSILFIVDATQSLGTMPIDFDTLNADVLIASNYKWMNGGFGTGLMCATAKFMEENPAPFGGFASYAKQGKLIDYSQSVAAYEPGHLNMTGFASMGVEMQQKLKIGLTTIEQHNLALCQEVLIVLQKHNINVIGGTNMDNRVSIIVSKGTQALADHLKANNIVVTFRDNLIRISPHYYNSSADIQRLDEVLSIFLDSA